MFENACHRIGIPHARANSVLMVGAPPDLLASGSQDLVDLLDEIHRHSPKAIGLIASGEPRQYQKLDWLNYARQLTVGYSYEQLFSNPGGKVSSHYQTGFSNLPNSIAPVFRKGRATMEQVGVRLPSLEGKIVKSLRGSTYALPKGDFVVTWCGGPGTIGRVNATELLSLIHI